MNPRWSWGPSLVLYTDSRLVTAQVEELLKKQEAGEMSSSASPVHEADNRTSDDLPGTSGFDANYSIDESVLVDAEPGLEFLQYREQTDLFPEMPIIDPAFATLNEGFSWEMIELGVEEPLPPQDTIDELYD